MVGEERFPGFFQRRVVIGIEIVETDNAVAAFFQGEGDMGTDETGGAGDKDRKGRRRMRKGGVTELFFPLDSPPRGG